MTERAIRVATPADLDAIVRVDVRSFTRHWPAEEFRAHLDDPLVTFLLADDPAGALGYAHVRAVVDEAELLNVAVDPRGRRCGLGRRLLEAAQAVARGGGAERMFLEVRADNEAAIGLYRSCGWEQVGIRKRYYSEDGADAIVMSIDLVEAGIAPLEIDPGSPLDGPIPDE